MVSEPPFQPGRAEELLGRVERGRVDNSPERIRPEAGAARLGRATVASASRGAVSWPSPRALGAPNREFITVVVRMRDGRAGGDDLPALNDRVHVGDL